MEEQPEGIQMTMQEMYQMIGELYVKNYGLQRDIANLRSKDKKVLPMESGKHGA